MKYIFRGYIYYIILLHLHHKLCLHERHSGRFSNCYLLRTTFLPYKIILLVSTLYSIQIWDKIIPISMKFYIRGFLIRGQYCRYGRATGAHARGASLVGCEIGGWQITHVTWPYNYVNPIKSCHWTRTYPSVMNLGTSLESVASGKKQRVRWNDLFNIMSFVMSGESSRL